jgi:hypothetical protein
MRLLSQSRLSGWLTPALLLLAAAFALRWWVFGNPVVHIDEQFYLWVGKSMLHGKLPFVDIWDRKPIGLFLVYAGIAAVAPDPILGYQIAATLCAAATAWILQRMALRVASPAGALIAALAYLVYFPALGGVGGQSPVFYNLPVALAAWITLATIVTPSPRGLAWRGIAVMLLLGIAIQIKYTVIFEGMFLGLALLWRGWKDGRTLPALAPLAALWVACALLPTAAVLLYYLSIGQAEAFLQANFLSIFGRAQPRLPAIARLLLHIVTLAPFGYAIRHAWRDRAADTDPRKLATVFVRCWAAAAIAGYLIFGSYYIHYALPLLSPLALAAAPALGWARQARRYALVLLVPGLLIGAVRVTLDVRNQGNAADIAKMVALIQPRLHGGCLYVYEGDPILYERTGACAPTRFAFPSHLNNRKERDALGIDVAAEMEKVLASKPSVIVLNPIPRRTLTNVQTRAMLIAELRRDYHLVAPVDSGDRTWLIFERRPRP